jgi:C1A family cysteine protease
MAEQDALVNDRNSYGCRGGFMDGRFEVTKGVTTEELCPYRTSDRYSCKGEKYAKATRWAMVGAANRAPTVDELRQAIIDYGVLAVTVAAGGSFSPNSSGRITTCGSRGINHMVTLAGYRPAPSGGYEFLIANSWGTNWGDGM